MNQAIITTANAVRWSRALERALAEAVDILVEPVSGEVFAESSSRPGTLYVVTRASCTCSAGRNGVPCKHRAAFLAQLGELELDPEPARVSFFGNSDRQEVRIDGKVYGDAVATEYGGWELFRGRFPYAKRMGTFCSLDEIERHLEE